MNLRRLAARWRLALDWSVEFLVLVAAAVAVWCCCWLVLAVD